MKNQKFWSPKAPRNSARRPPPPSQGESPSSLGLVWRFVEDLEARLETIRKWEERWNEDNGKAKWTKKLIKSIPNWIGRKFGEVNYFITQFHSGHGVFKAYLFKIGKKVNSECSYCGDVLDNAEHAILKCNRWIREKLTLELELNENLNSENIIKLMLVNKDNWNKISDYIIKIMKQRGNDEIAGHL